MKVITYSGTTHNYLSSVKEWEIDKTFLEFSRDRIKSEEIIIPKSDIKYIEK